MVSVKLVAFAGVTALFASAASAADLPGLPPIKLPVVEEFASGWYLRGDIGMTNQKVKEIHNVLFPSTLVWLDRGGFDSGMLWGVGIGYQFNHWFRADVTGEYRGKVAFKALDVVPNPDSPTGLQTNEYTASKSEWTFMLNAYVDLGTWYCITPFVGAGVGFSYNKIDHFRDVAVPVAGVAFADSAAQWNFAWALHAGVAYKVNPNFTVELAYRYISLGDAMSGDLTTYTGTNMVNNPMHFKGITSHDLKLGVRWMLEPAYVAPPVAYPPLMRRG